MVPSSTCWGSHAKMAIVASYSGCVVPGKIVPLPGCGPPWHKWYICISGPTWTYNILHVLVCADLHCRIGPGKGVRISVALKLLIPHFLGHYPLQPVLLHLASFCPPATQLLASPPLASRDSSSRGREGACALYPFSYTYPWSWITCYIGLCPLSYSSPSLFLSSSLNPPPPWHLPLLYTLGHYPWQNWILLFCCKSLFLLLEVIGIPSFEGCGACSIGPFLVKSCQFLPL